MLLNAMTKFQEKYVPVSMPAISEKDYTFTPHLRFKTNKTFEHLLNIVSIIKSGGCLRGFVERDGVGLVEIVTKRQLSDEAMDVKIGRGRRVSSFTVSLLISRKLVYFPKEASDFGAIVTAKLVDDVVIFEDFPAGWSVVYVPHTGKSALFQCMNESKVEVCLRPSAMDLETWLPLAKAMANGLALAS